MVQLRAFISADLRLCETPLVAMMCVSPPNIRQGEEIWRFRLFAFGALDLVLKPSPFLNVLFEPWMMCTG